MVAFPDSINFPLLGAIFNNFMCFYAPVLAIVLTIYAIVCQYWSLVGLYAVWFAYDKHSSRRGAYPNQWFRGLLIFRWLAEYFPVENYLIGYHPHGLIGMGSQAAISVAHEGLQDAFPGISWRISTLASNFLIPLRREFLMLLGFVDCSRESITHVLSQEKKGKALVLLIGGAEESLHAQPGSTTLVLKKRKGFVRLAMKTGAHLVPVYAFGENEIFEQVAHPEGSKVRRFQQWTKRNFGFIFPMFYGRALVLPWTTIPFSRPIDVHFGAPISVEKCADPTEDDVNKLHTQYMHALKALFNEHKAKYGKEDIDLNIC